MVKKSHHNIILTGIPRAGTTLSCHLLNKIADTVALHEPIQWKCLSDTSDHNVVCAEIDTFFQQMRHSLQVTQSAISQQRNRSVPDNPMGTPPFWVRWIPGYLLQHPFFRKKALRRSQVSRGWITVQKPLSAQFLLCIKHTGPFTALLNTLLQNHRCFAVIRNPLSVLLSWNSINFALREGHHPEAERFAPQLSHRLAQISDRIERQISLLSWFFARYSEALPPNHIIRYEDVIATGGRALEIIVSAASELDESLKSKNQNPLYDRRLLHTIEKALLNTDGAFWEFYTRESVQAICEKMRNGHFKLF